MIYLTAMANSGMNFRHHFGSLEVVFIVLQKQFTSFFIQGWLCIGNNQQALDSLQEKYKKKACNEMHFWRFINYWVTYKKYVFDS